MASSVFFPSRGVGKQVQTMPLEIPFFAAECFVWLTSEWFSLALLLIPQMGRSKYTMKRHPNPFGRNQLIGEYLWIASCVDLGPGASPDPQLLKIKEAGGRKMVSSHIQVLKNFFSAHRCCKWFYGPRIRRVSATPPLSFPRLSFPDSPFLPLALFPPPLSPPG